MSETGVRPLRARRNVKPPVADCDIHPALKANSDLYPYLEKRWQTYLADNGFVLRQGFENGFFFQKAQPDAARQDSYPPGGGAPASDPAFLREHHLETNNVELGILLPLDMGQGLRHTAFSAACCSAVNDWQRQTWVLDEPRLKGSIIVPIEDPAAAVAEIEKRAGDPAFVQVLVSRSAEPLGHRRYWPIFEAAVRAGLPVALHTGTRYSGIASTSGGWPSYYVEQMTSLAQHCQGALVSMVMEGLFEHLPDLKFVMVEGGFGWVPSLCWRMDRQWKKLKHESPSLSRLPSEYVAQQVWFTSQPMEEPENREHVRDLIDWIGWGQIMFASDYPHWDFDDPSYVLPVQISEETRRKFFIGNAKSLYRQA